jgi:hypothetical protein
MEWNTTNIGLITLIAVIFIAITAFRSIGEALFIFTIIILSKIKLKKNGKENRI